MKFFINRSTPHFRMVRKLMIIMKLTWILLLAGMLQVSASVYSQSVKFSINLKNQKVVEVLNEIEDNSEFRFFYQNEQVDLNRRVTVQTQDASVEEILRDIFEGTGVTYTIREEKLILLVNENLVNPNKTDIKQDKRISGKVTDEKGEPLPGVTVVIKGTSRGTVTDVDGNYSLSDISESTTLVFSFVGMRTQEVEAGSQTEIDISMEADAIGLEEVIAVGYGTQVKRKVTGAIAQVTSEEMEIEKRPVTSIQSALVGSIPGLVGFNANGAPGSSPSFDIRGVSSVNNTNILTIIDGFEGSLADLDPKSIESVSVLKDAAAVSIYGARGANGVMLVTTKQTKKKDRLSVAYHYNISTQTPRELPELLNSVELMEFENYAVTGDPTGGGNPSAPYSPEDLELANSGFYPETQWLKEMYARNNQQAHDLSVQGGTGKTGYLISASYLDQEGMVQGADQFKRLNLRIKVDTDLNKWLSIGTNALITNRVSTGTPYHTGDGLNGSPFFPVKSVDGLWVYKGSPGEANPVARTSSGSFNNSNRVSENIQLYARLKPIKGLTIEERISVINQNTNGRNWNNGYDFVTLNLSDPDSYTNPDSPNRSYSYATPDQRIVNLSSSKAYTLGTLTKINYDLDIDEHHLGVLLGFQSETGESQSFTTGRRNFLLDNVISMSLGQELNTSIGGGIGNSSSRGGNARTLSYFGRINYDYKGKYLAQFSFRRDGSSNFLESNQWAFFPAGSLGWNIAEEDFMSEAGFVDMFKVRVSYGQSGDDAGVGRRVVQLINLDPTGYPFGGTIQPRLYLGAPASRDLKWETATIFNTGLDFSLWEGKLQANSEYFINNRTDILDEVITPREFGFGNVPANLYAVKSWGWEFQLTHKNTVGQFKYWASANITNYDNEITDLAGREQPNFAVGQSINDRFGYVTDGFFNSQEDLDNNFQDDGETLIDQSNVGGSYIGGYKFVDQKTVDTNDDGVPDAGDGVINGDDRVIIERNSATNLIFGANLGCSYKGLTLTAHFYGAFDRNQWLNGAAAHEPFLNGTNAFKYQLDYWREDNKDAVFPVPQGNGIQKYNSDVTHLLFNNEFVKLQNVTLTYDFSPAQLQKIKIVKALSVALSVENIGTIWSNSPFRSYGWDPELGVGTVDYPLPITSSLGVNVKF